MTKLSCSGVHHNSFELVVVEPFLFDFGLHECFSGVSADIQFFGEFKTVRDLLVHKCVEVEHNSLEMHDEDVREVLEALPLHDLVLGMAFFAEIVGDDLALDEVVEGFLEILHSRHF